MSGMIIDGKGFSSGLCDWPVQHCGQTDRTAFTTRLVGDCDFDSCAAVAGAITPVPGGVGPMTIACLLANTVVAAARAHGQPVPDGLT